MSIRTKSGVLLSATFTNAAANGAGQVNTSPMFRHSGPFTRAEIVREFELVTRNADIGHRYELHGAGVDARWNRPGEAPAAGIVNGKACATPQEFAAALHDALAPLASDSELTDDRLDALEARVAALEARPRAAK